MPGGHAPASESGSDHGVAAGGVDDGGPVRQLDRLVPDLDLVEAPTYVHARAAVLEFLYARHAKPAIAA